MIRSWKTLLIGLMALGLSIGPVMAYDQEQAPRAPNSEEMFADAVVGRPLGLLGMVLGTAAFVVSLPFTLASGSTDQAAEKLVGTPTKFTFKRPLGRFISCEEQPELCK
jgi:hypothetical protein